MLLIILAVLIIGGLLTGYCLTKDNYDKESYAFGVSLCSFVAGFFFAIIAGTSYISYLDNRAFYDATVTQYRDQIKMYHNEAKINVKDISYTDFKYEGYQAEIATNIRILTNNVVDYNQSIIKKRLLKKNIIFSWLITAPDDDMVVISLIERKK